MNLKSGVRKILISEKSEHGVPAWIQGLRTYGWTADSKAIYLLKLKNGFSSLVRCEIERKVIQKIENKLLRRQLNCREIVFFAQ